MRSNFEQSIYAEEMSKQNVATAWIGVHDIFNEGEFVTVLDEELEDIGYANWTTAYTGLKQPDNAGGKQNCVNLVKADGGMDDSFCDFKTSYICQFHPFQIMEF